MNKTAIKNFAVWARTNLIDAVKQKAFEYEIKENCDYDSNLEVIAGRLLSNEEKEQRRELIIQIKNKGYEQVMEEVAYTWFNRFIALRFMEVNTYLPTRIRLFTDENGDFKPEILKEALTVELDELNREKVLELIEKQDNEGLYKYLLITQCNALNKPLPQMFEKISNYTELLFPKNLLKSDSILARMVNDIPEGDWEEIEIIGWLYQYYITDKHEEVVDPLHGKVVSKYDIPAATQLFTTDWVVKYIVDNSLGRYWIERNPQSNLSEKLQYFVKSKKNDITYLDEKVSVESIKVLDPCVGSGHFLSYAFDVLVHIYTEVGYSERDAVQSIIKNNLYGLEIDDRATQLAYFTVMMKGCEYDHRFLKRTVQPNVYSIQETNNINPEYIELFGDLQPIAQKLLDFFKDSKEYGSILQIDISIETLLELKERCNQILNSDYDNSFDTAKQSGLRTEFMPIINQAIILADKYEIVCTNPPYLNKMDAKLKKYVTDNYEDYKADLFSVFIYRNFLFCKENGYNGLMTPNVWMFIKSFEKLRLYLINNKSISSLIQMAKGAFFKEATVDVCSFVLKNSKSSDKGYYIRLEDYKGDMDVQKEKVLEALENNECKYFFETNNNDFSKIPGSPIAYWVSEKLLNTFSGIKLGDIAKPRQGLATGCNDYFVRFWYEVSTLNTYLSATSREDAQNSKMKWFPCNKGGSFRKWYGNNDYVVNWENDGYEIRNFKDENGKLRSRPQNMDYYFKEGMTWSTISSASLSMRYIPKGFMFETKGSVCFANDSNNLKYLLAIMNTPIVAEVLLVLSPTLDFHEGPLAKVPILIDNSAKERVTILSDENITLSKQDWDSFETSWDFKKHPLI